jgi:hypothetical protein
VTISYSSLPQRQLGQRKSPEFRAALRKPTSKVPQANDGSCRALCQSRHQKPAIIDWIMDPTPAAHEARRAEIGPNRYSLFEFGLPADGLPVICAEYVRQFGIERES